MDAMEYWKIFVETGAPELYLMYAKAMKSGEQYVSENKGTGTTCHRIQ